MAFKNDTSQEKIFEIIPNLGNKVKLRPLQLLDSELSVHWRNDPEIRDNLLSAPFPVTNELEKEWIEKILHDKSNSKIVYAIETIIQHNLIGFIYLVEIDWVSRVAWFGIMIGEKEYQGQGMAKEAMRLLFNYAFARLNLRKISLEVAAFNHKAINLYNFFGFVEEGRMIDQIYLNNEFHDVLIMSIFKKDFWS